MKTDFLKKIFDGYNQEIFDPKITIENRIKNFLFYSSVLMIISITPWVFFFSIKGYYPHAILEVFLMAVCFLVLWLLKKKEYKSAKSLLASSAFLWICMMTFFVEGVGVREFNVNHFYLLFLIFSLFFIFSEFHFSIKWFFVAISTILFFIVQFQLVTFQPFFQIEETVHLFGRHFVLLIVFLLLAITTKLYIKNIIETERALFLANHLQKKILSKILPKNVVGRLRVEGKGFVDKHINCSVLFADIVGFTKLSEKMSPIELVVFLNEIFGRFDDLTEKSGLQKIKTIGDAYMVASCSSNANVKNHADAILNLSIKFLDVITEYENISIRIGINSGPIMEGVIGGNKFTYDLWGKAVILASKMETTCSPGAIHMTTNTFLLLNDEYNLQKRKIHIEGEEGEMTTYQLNMIEN